MKILYINNICSNISVRLSIKSNKNLEVELDSVIKPGDYKFNINRININKEASLILRAQIGEKNMDYDLHLTPIVPIPSIPENKIKLKFRCLSTFRNGYVYRDTTEYFELPKELNSTKDYVEFTGNYGGPMGFIIKVKDDGSYCGYIYTKNGNSLGTFRKEGLSLTNREVFKMEIDRIMIK